MKMSKVLLVHHSDFTRKTCGTDVRIGNIVALLREMQIQVDLFVSGAVGASWVAIDPNIVATAFVDTGNLESEVVKDAYESAYGRSLRERHEIPSLSLVDENVRLRFWNVLRNQRYDCVIFSYVYYSPLL